MQDAPTSIMLKYLQVKITLASMRDKMTVQVLNNISTKNNRTVVVPIPKALLQPHVWRGRGQDNGRLLQAAVAAAVPVLQELCV